MAPWEVKPCWRDYATGGGLWEFVVSPCFLFQSLSFLCVAEMYSALVPSLPLWNCEPKETLKLPLAVIFYNSCKVTHTTSKVMFVTAFEKPKPKHLILAYCKILQLKIWVISVSKWIQLNNLPPIIICFKNIHFNRRKPHAIFLVLGSGARSTPLSWSCILFCANFCDWVIVCFCDRHMDVHVFECVGLGTEIMSTEENDRMFHLFSIFRQGFATWPKPF